MQQSATQQEMREKELNLRLDRSMARSVREQQGSQQLHLSSYQKPQDYLL